MIFQEGVFRGVNCDLQDVNMDQSKDVKMELFFYVIYFITVIFFVLLFVLMFYKLWVSYDKILVMILVF